MLCVNKIPENCGLHPENIHRLARKNGDRTTLVLFKLKNEGEEQHAKRCRIKIDDKIKNIREYVNKEKLIIRCFKCNKFGHLSNSCKDNNSLCRICDSNKQKCKGNYPKQHWKCVSCSGNHSAAWERCKIYKEKLNEVTQAIIFKSYAEAVKSDMFYILKTNQLINLLIYSLMLLKILINLHFIKSLPA